MTMTDDRIDTVEMTDLAGLGHTDIDDVLDYVHVPTAKLPGYLDLYDRYLRQRWNVNDLDFTQDRADWADKMNDDSRNSFLSIASGFHHGERQVEAELAPLFFGIPEDYKVFLTSHLEDEARHTVFFDRFYRDVVGLEGDGIMDVLDGSWGYIQETFVGPFGLLAYLTDDLRRDPYNKHLQMKYATTYMIWIEGVLALSVMKITLNYARDFKVLPAYYTGFTATCRDEARHVQGGMRFVRQLLDEDPSYVTDIHDTLRTLLTMGAARSGYVYYEPLGWSEERVQALFMDQLHKKLAMVGVSLPADLEEMLSMVRPTLAGG
ncbi:MAG: ribonucleotide-diphosphate reductase subunit beta [Acidimicrobiales bacterium]